MKIILAIILGLAFGIALDQAKASYPQKIAIGGYCPGTCIVAAGRGRKDALAFLAGGLLGALVYMLIFGLIQDAALFDKIAGGAVSLAETNPETHTSLSGNLPALLVAGPIAILFMLIAFLLPEAESRKP